MKPKKTNKILYMLHELSHREFESKVFFSFEFLKNNWKVYLLQRNFFFFNIKNLPPGVVVYKSAVPSDNLHFKKIKSAGHVLVCLDEESIAEFNSAHSINLKYGEEALKNLDLLVVSHNRSKKIILKKFPFLKTKIISCQHPRFDFIKYLYNSKDPISERIKKKYGRFVFLPTTFYCNHIMGKHGFIRMYEEPFKKLNHKQKKFLKKLYKKHEILIKQHKELFLYLGKKIKNIKFILRPHPSENDNYWKKLFNDKKQFIFDSTYPSFYYQKVADSIIQYNSTIAFESMVFKKKSLQYDPVNQINSNKDLQIFDLKKNIKSFSNKESLAIHIDKSEKYNVFKRKKNYDLKKLNSKKIFNNLKRFNFSSDYSKKILFYNLSPLKVISRYILYFLAKFKILNLLPQKFLSGKLKILKKPYISIHLNHFKYVSKKYKTISEDQLDFIKDAGKKYLRNPNFKIKRIIDNNFEVNK